MSVARLRTALTAAQPDLEPNRIEALLDRLAENPDALDVALRWLRTGDWPAEPEIEAWTPALIADFLPPFFVLSAWLHLQQDPVGAATALSEMETGMLALPEAQTDPQDDAGQRPSTS